MTYHFYLFVGKFPKLFNFSDTKEKIYLVEFNIFKENAFYDLLQEPTCLQKIVPDNFSRNFYIWSAIVNGTCMQNIKIGHRAKFRAKHKCFSHILFRFARFYAAFNLRWAYFDSLSLRMHLDEDCTRTCSKKPFRASLNAYRNPSCKNVYFCTDCLHANISLQDI